MAAKMRTWHDGRFSCAAVFAGGLLFYGRHEKTRFDWIIQLARSGRGRDIPPSTKHFLHRPVRTGANRRVADLWATTQILRNVVGIA